MTHAIRRSSRLLLPLTFLAFISIGVPDGVLGVAWPSVRRTFGLPLSQLGALLASGTIGYLVSSFNSGQIIARFGVGRLLLWSSVFVSGAAAAYALAPAWWVMVLFALFAGLGSGAIDGGLNVYAARHFTPRVMNWMHACYGVGAMLGPTMMTAVLAGGHSWRWGYGGVAAILGVMAVGFMLTARLWEDDEARRGAFGADAAPPNPDSGDAGSRDTAPPRTPAAPAGQVTAIQALRRPIVRAHVALFFVYTGIEATAGQWAYSLFTEARGMRAPTAGAAVALYWASLTAGRIVMGQAAARIPADAILRAAMIAVPTAGGIVWLDLSPALNILGLALIGFACAPIFPLLISQTPGRVGDAFAAHSIGFQVSAAYLGIAAIPGTTGVLARAIGLEVVAPVVIAAGVVLLLLHEAVLKSLRPRTPMSDLS